MPDDEFEREMSRNMRINGERKIRLEDISFESEAFNIYDPFFSSESESDYRSSSFDSLSNYDSETDRSSFEQGDTTESSVYTSSAGTDNHEGNRLSDLGRPARPEYFATHHMPLAVAAQASQTQPVAAMMHQTNQQQEVR